LYFGYFCCGWFLGLVFFWVCRFEFNRLIFIGDYCFECLFAGGMMDGGFVLGWCLFDLCLIRG